MSLFVFRRYVNRLSACGLDDYSVLIAILVGDHFFHGRDANVILTDISGDTFGISSDSLIQPDNAKLTMRLKFLLLIQALLKEEGEDLYSISKTALAKRFNVNLSTIKAAFNDLGKYGD